MKYVVTVDVSIRQQTTEVRMLVLFVFFPKSSVELSSIEDTLISGDVTFRVSNLIILLRIDSISLFLRLSQSAIISPIPRLSFLKFLFSFQRFLPFSTPVDFVRSI